MNDSIGSPVASNEGPRDTLNAYVGAFESLEADAVASFYHVPCVFVAPMGVTVASDPEVARAVATGLLDHARSQNYRRTEIRDVDVRMLGQRLASVSGTFVRIDSEGDEIGRFGFSYTMLHDGSRWKIVVAIAHDILPG